MLHVKLLGVPYVESNGKSLTKLNSSTAMLQLLCYLVMHRKQQPHLRSTLAMTLWQDLSEARARRTFNNILWRLRSSLGETEEILDVDSQMIQISNKVSFHLDIDEFEQIAISVLPRLNMDSKDLLESKR